MYYDFCLLCFFFFKQKTAYEMRISDWSSDVCSSDLIGIPRLKSYRHAVLDRCRAYGAVRASGQTLFSTTREFRSAAIWHGGHRRYRSLRVEIGRAHV